MKDRIIAINEATGEQVKNVIIIKNKDNVHRRKQEAIKEVKSKRFFKTFIDAFSGTFKLSITERNTLDKITSNMKYDNTIAIIPYDKRIWAKELNIGEQRITRAVQALTKYGILLKRNGGLYIVNPRYFAKGDFDNIVEIVMRFKYNEDYPSVEYIKEMKHE